jgi:hypothetical protein
MKKSPITVFFVAVSIGVTPILPAVPAISQVTELTAGASTGLVINQVQNSLSTLIAEATASGNFLAARAGQEALFVLDGFERANSNLLSKAFSGIGAERQAVINQIQQTTLDIESGRIDTLAKLEASSDQLDALVRDVTFRTYPVIYRYRGSIVTPGETTTVRLLVAGANLSLGTPYVVFRGQRYDAFKDGERLRFEIPRALFTADPDQMKSENATLHLEYKTGGILGLFQHTESIQYDLNVVTLPGNLATASISYGTIIAEPRERSFSEEVSHNSSSRSWNCRSFAYSPSTADRRFDVSRSTVEQRSGNSRGQLRDRSVRDVGITFSICAKRRWHDQNNGFRHARVSYVETWSDSRREETVSDNALNWTQDLLFTVPDQPQNLLIKVKDFTGRETILSAAGGTAGRYAQVIYDQQSDVVIVRPRPPADVSTL